MADSAILSEHTTGSEDSAWLVGFPIAALLIVLVVLQTILLPIARESMATGVCHQAGASEAAFRALMLH